jgi:thiamine pyrophosphokinase
VIFFKSVKITKVSDQDSTDFMKCVALLNEKEEEQGQIVCQSMQNIVKEN